MHVAIRSPIPASPAKVAGSPPSASPNRLISLSPRVTTVARVLSPVPSPSAMPEAMAITFLSTPPSSHPMTSWWVYTRKRSPANRGWSAPATCWSSMAITLAAASPARISFARFGPVSTATGWPGSSCSTIWDIRSRVPTSSPLVRLTTGTHGLTHGASSTKVDRNPCDGTPMTTTSASRTARSRSPVQHSASGRPNPGR